MQFRVNSFAKKLGFDEAIFYTIAYRVVQAVGGLFSIFFIAKYLSKVEQGYYYTFASIISIQVFFELGLTGIITQFVSHENSFITWGEQFDVSEGEREASRLSSLLHFSFKWFGILSFISLITLITVGYFFFNSFNAQHGVNWGGPFLLLCLATSVSLNSISILAFFEGVGKVKEVAKIRFLQQVIFVVLICCFFLLNFKLYAAGLASLISLLSVLIFIITGERKLLLSKVIGRLGQWRVKYMEEIFPLQWKIAASWISLYLMYQLFNPILFATQGAEAAGQMGMTLAALNGIFAIALSWLNTKIPLFTTFVAQKKYRELDKTFKTACLQAGLIAALLIAFFITFVSIAHYLQLNVANRFLSIGPLCLLSTAMFANHIVYALAVYLRSHKQEPFLIISLVLGAICSVTTFFSARLYGVIGITFSFAFVTVFIGVTWAVKVFNNKRKEWHAL